MSKLRCWPGCIAQITHPDCYGRIVLVIEGAPVGRFNLPDGQPHLPTTSVDPWVCEAQGWSFPALVHTKNGKVARPALFAVIDDQWLRPIVPPPGTVTDSEVAHLFAPQLGEVTV